jgi:hypothetical protein
MYDFAVQKNMLNVSLELLDENNIKDIFDIALCIHKNLIF